MERDYVEELSPWDDKNDTVFNLIQLHSRQKRCEVKIKVKKPVETSFKTINSINISSPKLALSPPISHKQILTPTSWSLFHNSRIRT